MDPAVVAAFYQGKGYAVREGARVAGLSGNQHRVPLLAEGPLGSLAIFFGDFGGVDGPEMGGARKAARDIGATPVLAADSFSNQDRQVAARLGVVLLDGSLIAGDDEPPAPATSTWPGGLQVRPPPVDEPEPHPWPASGRVGGRDGPAARAIDIDDLLADTRRATPEPATEPATEPALERMEAITAADGDGLWKHPRPAPSGRPAGAPRPSGGPKFAWLGARADAPTDPSGSFSVDYDEVVPARPASGGDTEAPRLGDDDPELKEAIEQEDRLKRRDRLQRRLFWILFAFVFLYLFYLFWT